jgi:predicted nuclease with TOPRIM domain
MTTTPTTLTYTLEEVLSRFEQKMDRQFAELNQKLEKIDDRLSKLEIGQAELSGEIKALDERLTGQIKTLDEKVSGIDKRLDNQEFINRGILVAVVIALLSGAAKLFDLLPK